MSNNELLAKIKVEIERRMLELARDKYIDLHDTLCRTKELHLLLSFLSTLESEKPVPADLEEYASRAGFDYVDNIVQEHPGHRFNDHDVEYAYRDGIIAGAKWQYQKDRGEFAKIKAKTWCEGFDACKEQMPLPEDTVIYQKGVAEGRRLAEEEQADLFTIVALDAAQRAKEQMMQEAVEGIVTTRSMAGNIVTAHVDYRYKDGQKVRVIIVKEDEE